MPKRRSSVAKGFHSKKQWALFFSRPDLKRHARKIAHRTQRNGGGKIVAYRRLPRRKGARKRT